MPCKWSPLGITQPGTSFPFTDDSAWTYVADAIDAGCEIATIALDNPPGKIGYVMLLASANTTPIYVKLQLLSGRVLGRSFHYSEYTVWTEPTQKTEC